MNNNKYPNLTSPIQLGKVTFRNRIFSAPMGATDITADCCPGPRTQGFYELRAKGGAAAVTVSELVVHPETDGSHMLHLDLETVGCLAAHTFVADAIRRHGAVPSIELSHSGQYAGTYMSDKNKKASLNQWGPSDGVRPDGRPVKALSKEQIADIVKAYGEKAALCKRAGYEMIMVHAGHGWLLHQFLSPYLNHRTDEYGGSLDNRIRIVREVLASVRNAVGPGFPVEVRLSGSELFDGGYGIEDGIKIAQAVEDLVDLIHVSAGSYQFGFFNTTPPMFDEHGVNVWLAAEIKKHVKKPVATIGALSDPEQMEHIIAVPSAKGDGWPGRPYREVLALLHLYGRASCHLHPPLCCQPIDWPRDRGYGGVACSSEQEGDGGGCRRCRTEGCHYGCTAGSSGDSLREDGQGWRYSEVRTGSPVQV